VTHPAVDFYVYAVSRYADAEHYRRLAQRYLAEGIERFRASRVAAK
jgi:hypothetical protein